MLTASKPPLGEAYLSHISMRPWSEYTEADYTLEQWHRACLIHQHDGAPTSKTLCKLPVRTPNGALNKNGVHAAMAALNGARGGLKASTEEKTHARAALLKLYKELDEEPPGFFTKHAAMLDGEDLLHAGVKGMRWGHRKPEDTPMGDPRRRNEVLVKTAMVAGAVAVGAILLHRGGFKLSTPASRRLMLGGARSSMRIVQTSGRAMATTSVRVGSTVGKTAFKSGTKVGSLVVRGSYSGAIAGSKAAARAVAQNGSKFYTNIIKKSALSTVKLGSHAMYKLTGRGTPIANSVARRSMNISLSDLLLNVRADRWGGRS